MEHRLLELFAVSSGERAFPRKLCGLRPEDKKVVVAVRLNEIVVRGEHKARPFDLANHHIAIHPEIITPAVAIDDS